MTASPLQQSGCLQASHCCPHCPSHHPSLHLLPSPLHLSHHPSLHPTQHPSPLTVPHSIPQPTPHFTPHTTPHSTSQTLHPSLHPPQHPSLHLSPFTTPSLPLTHPSPLLTTPLTPPLQYLHSYKQLMSSEVDTANEGQHSTRLAEVEMSLEALSNVIRNNNGELQQECTVATDCSHPAPPPPLPLGQAVSCAATPISTFSSPSWSLTELPKCRCWL